MEMKSKTNSIEWDVVLIIKENFSQWIKNDQKL